MRTNIGKRHNRDKDDLNLREALFARLYIINKGNGRQAAEDAGYVGDCAVRACGLLADPRIKRVINREGARLVAKLEIKAERVLHELARIAFFDFRQLFKPDQTIIPFTELDPDTAAVISGLDLKKAGVLRLRFADKIRALDLLGRYLRMWDGAGDSSSDRLREVLNAFRSGPVADKKEMIQ